MDGTLISGFLASAARTPEAVAVEVEGRALTYGALLAAASAWAATLDELDPGEGQLTAVLGARSATAVTGVVSALLRGHGYVPLSPSFPAPRLADMLDRSGCTALIVDQAGLAVLPALLERTRRTLVIGVPEGQVAALEQRFPAHTWCTAPSGVPYRMPTVPLDRVAYLLFTSGSTGRPKGVMVSHANIRHFLDVMVARYGFGPDDRFSQTFELVFDLSLFDYFCAWQVGATVVVPSRADLLAPARYLIERRLTVWFSVPSLGQLMRRLRMLQPDAYPTLRWVLFCGEALPATVAAAFDEAAPNALVENLYGPTEVTLACTLYRWDRDTSPAQCLHGNVPIGAAYPGLEARVVDGDGAEVGVGESGELVLHGPQVCPGYWNDPERTRAAFVRLPGLDGVHYRTGDRVQRPGAGEPLVYLGRIDFQVKVQGYRVELGEIEAVIEELCGTQGVVVPYERRGATALAAFVLQPVDDLAARLAERLPDYMVPTAVHVVDAFPLNTNGKIDRPELARRAG